MAKANTKINKSALIRDFLAAHKRKTPSQISAIIVAEKGIEIPPQYISNVKGQMKGKRKARRLAKTAASGTPSAFDDRAALFAAAKLIVAAGAIDQARAALDAVAKVAQIVR